MNPFVFVGCVELREILGQRAEDEKELADLLAQVPPGSVYYHTHGFFLRSRVFASTYTNDFAAWVVGEVRDPVLGEKLAMVDPFEFRDLEALREELVSVIDHHLSRQRAVPRIAVGQPFDFLQSHVIELPVGLSAETLTEFRDALGQVDASAIYFHLFEARVRQGRLENDFSNWLRRDLGLGDLADRVRRINPYVGSLERVRSRLLTLVDEALEEVR
ncbi:MAG TPA: DUF5752 family protein [Methylomirabilota bacterium]|nr:DUF5752 family protein [Methylomirabilota bacterium]